MNIKLLNKVKKAIKTEPKQFQMHSFFMHKEEIPNCKTAACIAGHAIAVHKSLTPLEAKEFIRKNCHSTFYMARKYFELSDREAIKLFHFENWPDQFRKQSSSNVKQAIARIDHFIKTKGEE